MPFVVALATSCLLLADPPDMPGMDMSAPAHHHHMMSGPLDLPLSRDGSGTSWQPDETPHRATHWMAGSWMLMLHGVVFAGWERQSGPRGGDAWLSTSWLMLHAIHPLAGDGELRLRAMLSAEPATIRPSGYPLLLQSGEAYHGAALHDVQHPHDLFMELSATATSPPIADTLALSLYAAPSGEPALGPVAFPHRASAIADPFSPIGHHWEDSTHVAFGVLTAGAYTRHVKLEGSWFNGREPDAVRTNFDFRPLDSWSGRFSFAPTGWLVAQASYGYLKSPEQLEPDVSQRRTTASAMVEHAIGDAHLSATAVWARIVDAHAPSSDALLAEATLDDGAGDQVFGRIENLRKTAADLSLAGVPPADTFALTAGSAGYVRTVARAWGWSAGVGGVFTVDFLPSALEPFYGGGEATGGMLFVRVTPE